MSDNLQPRLTSVKRAAELLDLKPASVYRLLNEGAIESKQVGRLRKVVVASLDAYVESDKDVA